MVDAKHPRLVEHGADGGVDRAGRFQRVADGFFQHDARCRTSQAGVGQVRCDGFEQTRCGGQVVDPHALVITPQAFGQAAEIGALRSVHGEVVEARGEAGPGIVGEIGARHLSAAVTLGQGLVGLAGVAAAGQGEDAHIGVQASFAVQVIKRWQQFMQGQIARTTEDQHVAGDAQGKTPTRCGRPLQATCVCSKEAVKRSAAPLCRKVRSANWQPLGCARVRAM